MAAILEDPMQMEQSTKDAARKYQAARAHANEVAPLAKPSRMQVERPSKRK